MTKEEIKAAPIGAPVKTYSVMYRTQGDSQCNRKWTGISRQLRLKWRPGYLTGWVYLRNGNVNYFGEDGERDFTPKGPALFAARVKYSNRGREYYVLPEDVEVNP